ncbi:MAG: DNA adenine methylase [Nitrospinae bacterium]|nr:DNA adenine methylase [Nitrospinota bacterium]
MRKSFLSYLGGKSIISNKIIPLIPKHTCYCEVFAGAAWLLFKKDESDVEVLNDINKNLVTLYRVVKHHLDEFIRFFRWILVARDEFQRFKDENPSTLTDIQRAVRFYYLLKTGYASRVDNPTFTSSTVRPSRLNLLRIEEELSAAHLRLVRVFIENMHYEKLIERYDKAHTFFYLDPPYYDCEGYYGKGIFYKDDFVKIRDILKSISGKFIMSINNTKEIRELYKDFNIKKVETMYNIGGVDKKQKVTELLIMNF